MKKKGLSNESFLEPIKIKNNSEINSVVLKKVLKRPDQPVKINSSAAPYLKILHRESKYLHNYIHINKDSLFLSLYIYTLK